MDFLTVVTGAAALVAVAAILVATIHVLAGTTEDTGLALLFAPLGEGRGAGSGSRRSRAGADPVALRGADAPPEGAIGHRDAAPGSAADPQRDRLRVPLTRAPVPPDPGAA